MASPAKPDPLDPDDERKPVCPRCSGCTIFRRTGRREDRGGYWWCADCVDPFEEPAYRPSSRGYDHRSHISAAGRAAMEWEPEE